MTFSAKCLMPRLAALAIATTLVAGCETGDSDGAAIHACPPVVEYRAEFQARAATELERLPAESALAAMLSDYAVLRDQVRACQKR
jgi:hypothetical protein